MDYIYTRELINDKYNIGYDREKSKLNDEILIALPGKVLNYIKCNGSQVIINITPDLITSEKTILDTVVQDHKNNSGTNILSSYVLIGKDTIDKDKNINLYGLHREDIIDSKGSLITKNYYKNYDGTTYSDLAVKDEYNYIIDSVTDLVQYRTETISWYRQDGTVGDTKVITKYYNLNNSIKEGIIRRTNLIDKAKTYGLANISGTHVSGIPNSHYFFNLIIDEVERYKVGTIKQDLINIINTTTESYITQTIKDNLVGILDYWSV